MTRDPVEFVAELIRERGAHVVGIAGIPGSGKTTLACAVVELLGGTCRQVSLDDFCYSREERARRGLRWRAMPGSHDLDLLLSVLSDVRSRKAPIDVPRYSPATDDRIGPARLEAPPDPLVLDGWLLGYGEHGYARILDHLDLLVFLDTPVEIAKTRRFKREEELQRTGGGFDPERMQRFWDEVLASGIERIVSDARQAADVVVSGH